MGLGVLEDHALQHVPGTANILENDNTRSSPDTPFSDRLKYDRSGTTPILLIPQPTDDPNDPLNQPRWQRDFQLAALSLMAIVATVLSPILAADSLVIAFHYKLDFGQIALLTGYHLLAVGITAIFCVPSACYWGKRHLYLVGGILVCASTAWAGSAGGSYKNLLWSRVVQGIGLAPFESLLNASVTDLFFVHERGKRMALANLSLFGGAFLAPVIVGKLTATLGWEWSFKIVAIISGALLPVLFFFVPETAYRRPIDTAMRGATNVIAPTMHEHSTTDRASIEAKGFSTHQSEQYAGASLPEKVSYAQTLLPFNGRKTNDKFFAILLRPFPLLLQPAISWAMLMQGTLIGWTVFIGIVLAAILLGPPLWFTSVQVGYMYTSAFIGALAGFVVCGIVSDWSAKAMARRNNGIYEPEFRLLLVIPALIFGCMGLYGFGYTAADTYRYGWIGPEVFFGFEVAGMVCAAVASATYLSDAYPHIAVEAFTCCILFKNIFSFGMTYRGYDWLVINGTKRIFTIVASAQVAVCVLTIPLYLLGKRNRSFFARHDVLKKLKLR